MSAANGQQEHARKLDRWIGLALACLTFCVLWVSHASIGFTRDEGYYFKAARLYWGYFEAIGVHISNLEPWLLFTKAEIDKHWSYNHEHPVLVKTAFALSYGVFHQLTGWLNEAAAIRLPAWIFAGLSSLWLYQLARYRLNQLWSIFAVLIWISMPRVFWHMHLACFDIPVCAMHLLLVLTYWRVLHKERPWWYFGLMFGLSAAVKHNILVAPFFLLYHAVRTRHAFLSIRHPIDSLFQMPKMWWGLVTIAPVVFLIHWPYLWPNPLGRIAFYLGFHLGHVHYPISYFGTLWVNPPFPIHFPFVMSAITIPVAVTFILVIGLVVFLYGFWSTRLRQRTYRPRRFYVFERLMWINGLFPFLLIALPSSPIFGGTKHWMNGIPFWIVLSLIMVKRISKNHKSMQVAVIFAIISQFFSVTEVHPYGLSYYNALAGFERGAAHLGMQRTFWGYETLALMEHVKGHSERRWVLGDTNQDDMLAYVRNGIIDQELKLKWLPRTTQVSLVQPQGEFKELFLNLLDHYPSTSLMDWTHIHGVPLAVFADRALETKMEQPIE